MTMHIYYILTLFRLLYLSIYALILKTKNIFRDELKISTADNRLLFEKINKTNFIKVEDYIKKELKL